MTRPDNKKLALEYLRSRIITCEYEPGRAISADEIALRLKISKTPVREAILELEHEGFLQVFPHHSTVVTNVSLADLRLIYDARLVADVALYGALPVATLKRRRIALQTLRDKWDKIGDPQGDRELLKKFLDDDMRLHEFIISLSDNPYLADFCRDLLIKSQRFWYMAFYRTRADLVRQEHLEILDSLLAPDPPAAAAALRHHLLRSLSILNGE